MTRLRSRASFFWFFGAAAFVTATAMSGGCSVIFHADANQCSADSDCVARGALFDPQYSRCVQGTCVPTPSSSSSSVAAIVDAGCTKNTDCLEAGMDPCQSGVACNVDTGQCLNLLAPGCQFVIGDYCGANDSPTPSFPPLFLGAFAIFPPAAPQSDPSYANYELAVDEFQGFAAGVPAGPIVPNQPNNRLPVVVACDAYGDLDQEMGHLIGDLGVSTIVAPITLTDLGPVFSTYAVPGTNPFDGGPGYKGTLMINPFAADSTLTSLTTRGLLWHMLGPPSNLAPAYGAFWPLVEAYVQNNAPWNPGSLTPSDGGAPKPMKVATVSGPNQLELDLFASAMPFITWNGGQSAQANMNGTQPATGSCPCQSSSNYCALQFGATSLDPTTQITTIDNEIPPVVQCLLQYRPQVIISFASLEFTLMLQQLENTDPTLQPFYLLSTYNDQDAVVTNVIEQSPNLSASRDARLAGINYASAVDSTVLDAYNSRFVNNLQNGPGQAGLGQENYYDAMYFAIYSAAAVGRLALTGNEVAQGMSALIGQSPPYAAEPVGPGPQMGTIFDDIGPGGQTISLVGTLGPPNFDLASGARISQGDVFCLQYAADAGASYAEDVLRLANPDGGLAPDGGGALTGTFPCYSGIQ